MVNVASLASAALTAGNGIRRLAPTCVPRSFLQPGRRLKLCLEDSYALGMHRGGMDERCFGSTTEEEALVTSKAVADGVEFKNTGTKPLVTLRYFGPDARPKAPNAGDYEKN